jgi:FtsP/CotA-like multicopper oxidase with cupredoxin domain
MRKIIMCLVNQNFLRGVVIVKKRYTITILKIKLILAGVMVLAACSPLPDGGELMNDMMDGMKDNMMNNRMSEDMDSNDHESSSSHSYLPFHPLLTNDVDPESVYHPGSIKELKSQISDDGFREFKITADVQPTELKEGVTVEAWAYNGQIPGPLLRVKEGERVRIIFENKVTNIKTAIHWHGLIIPNDMDGVPPITQPYVRDGDRFIYEFTAKPSGTFWYHAHSMGDGAEQLDRGLLAPLIIGPEKPETEPKTDREWIVTLDEWQVEGAGSAPPSNDGSMNSGGMMEGGMMGDGMMNSHLLGTARGYNVFTINGRANLDQPFTANTNEWVRLRLLNGGFQQHRIHIHGMKAWVSHTDGHSLPIAQPVDELVISPYERLDVLLYGTEQGDYILHDHTSGHSEAGMQAKIKLTKPASQSGINKDKPVINDLPDDMRNQGMPRYQNLIAGIPGPNTDNYDRKYNLNIGMEMGMGNEQQWTINGKGWNNSDPLPIREGERVVLTITNMSPENHPMHLHGHEFEIVSINGRTISEPWLLKDTINLRPMDSFSIAFEANNPPGDWLFHCHQGHHADGGLMTVFRYDK